MEHPAQYRSGRRRRAILAGSAGVLVLALAAVWVARRDLASDIVDRRLAAAGVRARYRIAALGPATQVIDDVSLGDPDRPDFVARRVELRWRYRFGAPVIAGVRVDGGRLRARWRDGRLSLGAIDRLLPQGSDGAALPDLDVALRDARVSLETPFGAIDLAIGGEGNAARDFRGRARAESSTLVLADCAIGRTIASLDITTATAAAHLRGPIALAPTTCPARRVAIGAGRATIDLRLAPDFTTARGAVALAGFPGRAAQTSFGPIHGRIGLAGGRAMAGDLALTVGGVVSPQARARNLEINGRYRLDAGAHFDGIVAAQQLAAPPAMVSAIRSANAAMRETPLGPSAEGLSEAAGALLIGADVDAPLTLTTSPARMLSIQGARIRARGLAAATLSATLAEQRGGWTLSARLDGGGLPTLDGRAARIGSGGAVEAVLTAAPYRREGAALALAPIRIRQGHGAVRFATVATLDGPLGRGGSIEGLTIPIAGTFDPMRGLSIGEGCPALRFTRLRAAGVTLDPARVTLCGSPILARSPTGTLRLAAVARDLALDGRSGAVPLSLRAASLRFGTAAFAVERVAVRLGAADDPTRLNVAALDGTLSEGRIGGTFRGAAGAIGHVPLALDGAAGDWRVVGGALHLTGGLQVADRGTAPRFLSLATRDVALDLADGRLSATASLQTPSRAATIARVSLRHDLASGTGGALIDVAGIAFARGGLQPEMLTPLTLGVIANVAGTITGQARIDWTATGVTSSGTFATERIDLAAAFGPVAGIAGTIRFTDLLGLVTAPHQEARIAEINPGVAVANGVVHYQLVGSDRIRVEDARWPFAGGTLALDPATLDLGQTAERRLTFRVTGLDAAAFIQQLDFPNIAATGRFDGSLPMVFDESGGRIDDGALTARGPGTLAYVGELSNAQLGTMGKLAFDALKAIRYSGLDIALGGRLDGEIVTRVRFDGVRQATGDKGLVATMIRNLPFRFNIQIRAPFRGLVGSARSYVNPALLLQSPAPAAVQPAESAPAR